MRRNFFIVVVILALLSLFLIFFSLLREIDAPLKKEMTTPPPQAPFHSAVAGVGIIEPSSGNINIGTPLNRIIEKVDGAVGQKVKKGDVLFQLEDRDLQAELLVQLAAYKNALAKYQRLEAFPRSEDVKEAELAVQIYKSELNLAKNQYEMVQKLPDPRAISEEEKNRRYNNYQQAEAKWQEAVIKLDKIKAGTWKPDLEIAQTEVQQAKANFNRVKTEIDRTLIRAPIDGTLLQVNIHEGEFPPVDTFSMPMMVLGDIEELQLRVSINQLDIPYFQPDAQAVAFSQGDRHYKYPLEFVRVEPFLVGKQNLTNEITEKVDTRVLKIIYKIKKDGHPLYVGQQMDVFIEMKS